MKGKDRGIALIVVILAICAIVPVTLDLQIAVRGAAYDSINTADRIHLQLMADSGINIGQAILINRPEKPYVSLTEKWAHVEDLMGKDEKLFPNGKLRIQIEDELGKIPLNTLLVGNRINGDVKNLIIRLLCSPEFSLPRERAEEIVAAIIDWIDSDEEVTPGGAESNYYLSQPSPYEAKGLPLDDIYELLMIKGITVDLFYGTAKRPGLKDLLTLHGTGRININTAPFAVLRVLAPGITEDLAREMDLYRRNESNDLSDVMWYKRLKGMTDISISRDLLTVSSNVFRIQSEASIERMKYKISAIVELQGVKKPKLLAYRWER